MYVRHDEFEHVTEYYGACEPGIGSTVEGVFEESRFLLPVGSE
jgi:hypothetical protein